MHDNLEEAVSCCCKWAELNLVLIVTLPLSHQEPVAYLKQHLHVDMQIWFHNLLSFRNLSKHSLAFWRRIQNYRISEKTELYGNSTPLAFLQRTAESPKTSDFQPLLMDLVFHSHQFSLGKSHSTYLFFRVFFCHSFYDTLLSCFLHS